MAKKTKTRRASTAPVAERYTVRPSPNWPLLALAIVGMLLTGYLTWAKFNGGAVQGCAVGGGCDVVLTSRWATLLGVPTSLWGLCGYAALAAIAFVRRADRQWSRHSMPMIRKMTRAMGPLTPPCSMRRPVTMSCTSSVSQAT